MPKFATAGICDDPGSWGAVLVPFCRVISSSVINMCYICVWFVYIIRKLYINCPHVTYAYSFMQM